MLAHRTAFYCLLKFANLRIRHVLSYCSRLVYLTTLFNITRIMVLTSSVLCPWILIGSQLPAGMCTNNPAPYPPALSLQRSHTTYSYGALRRIARVYSDPSPQDGNSFIKKKSGTRVSVCGFVLP